MVISQKSCLSFSLGGPLQLDFVFWDSDSPTHTPVMAAALVRVACIVSFVAGTALASDAARKRPHYGDPNTIFGCLPDETKVMSTVMSTVVGWGHVVSHWLQDVHNASALHVVTNAHFPTVW